MRYFLNLFLGSSSDEDSNNVNAAVFYSISSTQKGLQVNTIDYDVSHIF